MFIFASTFKLFNHEDGRLRQDSVLVSCFSFHKELEGRLKVLKHSIQKYWTSTTMFY